MYFPALVTAAAYDPRSRFISLMLLQRFPKMFSQALFPVRALALARVGLRFKSYPAHIVLNMPALSPTMTAGTIVGTAARWYDGTIRGLWKLIVGTFSLQVEWTKNVGDKISGGDVMAKVETDKATVDFENQADEGYIGTFDTSRDREADRGRTTKGFTVQADMPQCAPRMEVLFSSSSLLTPRPLPLQPRSLSLPLLAMSPAAVQWPLS
jgi:hypothetical protein